MDFYTVTIYIKGESQPKILKNVNVEGIRLFGDKIYFSVYNEKGGGAEGIYIGLDIINNFYIKKQKAKMIEKTLVVVNHDGTTTRYGGLIEVFEHQFGMAGDKELSFMTKQQIVKKTILTTYHLLLDNIRSYAVEEIEIDAEDDAV